MRNVISLVKMQFENLFSLNKTFLAMIGISAVSYTHLYILRMSKEMGTSSDGTCNEEYKTIPDYEVTIARKKENYLDDECIQKVLELENLK